MNKLKVIVVATETEGRIVAKHLLENENFAISSYVACKSDSFLKINGVYPDIVLCVDEGDKLVFELARRIYVSMPGVVIVFATGKGDEAYKDSTVELGFHMIVNASIEPEEFYVRAARQNTIEKKRLTDDQRKISNAKIVSVYSAKGGCGKTVVATNLALLSAQDKRKTLLIDASFHFGDVCLYLDLNPKDTIAELVQEGNSITIDTINNFSSMHTSGLNVLPAPKSPEYSDYITEEHIEKLLSLLRPYYEVIIIDLPVTLNNTTLAAIENSDTVLYVATSDIASLKDMHLLKKVMQSLQQANKFVAVLNRVGKEFASVSEFKKNSAFDVICTIREEHAVQRGIETGTPIVLFPKKYKIISDFKLLGQQLLNEME